MGIAHTILFKNKTLTHTFTILALLVAQRADGSQVTHTPN